MAESRGPESMTPGDLSNPDASDEPADDDRDYRLYLPQPEGWQARVKQGWEKQYCYAKFPGEDHFHLILNGEIFLERGDEKLCLTCAMRRHVITVERLFWQSQSRRAAPRVT